MHTCVGPHVVRVGQGLTRHSRLTSDVVTGAFSSHGPHGSDCGQSPSVVQRITPPGSMLGGPADPAPLVAGGGLRVAHATNVTISAIERRVMIHGTATMPRMKASTALVATLLMLGACKKHEEPQPTPVAQVAPGSAAKIDAGLTDAEKVAKGMADADADAAKEAARWTPELVKAAVALRDQNAKDTATALAAILASPHRVPGNKDRDGARHPSETLTFFGLQPTQTVVEIGPGNGWYTELLAPLLADHGKLIVAAPDAKQPPGKMSTVSGHRFDLFLAKSPELFGKVERVNITSADTLKLGPEASADLVIAMREMHDWQRDGELDKYLAAIHAVLKPGGTFGVEAHRAKPGTKGEDTAASGYLAEQWVIDRVTAAGFTLAARSEINANPKDTKDYAKGVWTLPPNYREGDKDKATYTAIGESDRMTLKFTKK